MQLFFTLFPPIQIEGSAERSPNIIGFESLKKITISSDKITCVVDIEGDHKSIDVIKFNDPITDINNRIEPNDDLPLELMPFVTVELFERLAKYIAGYSIISSKVPETGYMNFFRGDLYPISIRGPDKQLYALTAELRHLRKDYFVALNSLLEVDFEAQLETSLATFVENVLHPMSDTMKEVYELHKEDLDCDDSVVNIIGSDFKRLVSRTEELISIVNYNMDQTAERNKAFLRLTLPLMLKQALMENFNDYFQFDTNINSISLTVKKRKIIPAEKLLDVIINFIK